MSSKKSISISYTTLFSLRTSNNSLYSLYIINKAIYLLYSLIVIETIFFIGINIATSPFKER